MNSIHRSIVNTSIVVVVVLAIGIVALSKGNQVKDGEALALASESDKVDEKSAMVQVAPIREGTIEQTIWAYGSVIPAPGKTKVLAIPFAVHVKSVYVTEGQSVRRGDRLLEVCPSPDEKLTLEKAMIRYEAAEKRLKTVEERFSLKLATGEELLQAQQAFEEAKAQIQMLKNMDMAGDIVIFSKSNGMVSRLFKTKGALVAAGTLSWRSCRITRWRSV